MTDIKTAPVVNTQEIEESIAESTASTPKKQNSLTEKKDYSVDVREVASDIFNPVVWQHMKGMADVFVRSGAFGQQENGATLMVKMQAGREMGMTPIESIKSFYFVKGVINIYGSAVTRRLRNHGWAIKYDEKPDSCTATVTKGNESFTDTLTFDEAVKSKWVNDSYGKPKAGWLEGANRKLKLRYGVLSLLIKTYIPEVLGAAVDIAEVAEDTVPLFAGQQDAHDFSANPEDNQPASEAQIQTLHTLEVEFDEKEITKGQAKAMILGATKKKGK